MREIGTAANSVRHKTERLIYEREWDSRVRIVHWYNYANKLLDISLIGELSICTMQCQKKEEVMKIFIE